MAMMAITTRSSMSVNAHLDSAFISLQLSTPYPSCRRVREGGVDDFGVLESKALYPLELLNLDISKIKVVWLTVVLETYVAL